MPWALAVRARVHNTEGEEAEKETKESHEENNKSETTASDGNRFAKEERERGGGNRKDNTDHRGKEAWSVEPDGMFMDNVNETENKEKNEDHTVTVHSTTLTTSQPHEPQEAGEIEEETLKGTKRSQGAMYRSSLFEDVDEIMRGDYKRLRTEQDVDEPPQGLSKLLPEATLEEMPQHRHWIEDEDLFMNLQASLEAERGDELDEDDEELKGQSGGEEEEEIFSSTQAFLAGTKAVTPQHGEQLLRLQPTQGHCLDRLGDEEEGEEEDGEEREEAMVYGRSALVRMSSKMLLLQCKMRGLTTQVRIFHQDQNGAF